MQRMSQTRGGSYMNLTALAEADISNKGEKFGAASSRLGKDTGYNNDSRGSIDSQEGAKVGRCDTGCTAECSGPAVRHESSFRHCRRPAPQFRAVPCGIECTHTILAMASCAACFGTRRDRMMHGLHGAACQLHSYMAA